MFGSDWPVCLLAATYHEVADTADTMAAGLSDHERSQLFEGTALDPSDLRDLRGRVLALGARKARHVLQMRSQGLDRGDSCQPVGRRW